MRKFFNKLSNQKGLSLIEVIVAAAISVIISGAVMKTNQTGIKGVTYVSSRLSLKMWQSAVLVNQISNPTTCMTNLSTSLGGIQRSNILGQGGTVIAQNGQEIPGTNGDWQLGDPSSGAEPVKFNAFVEDTAGSTKGRCDLTVTVSSTKKGFGGKSINLNIPVSCTTNAARTAIESCSATAESSDTLWELVLGNGSSIPEHISSGLTREVLIGKEDGVGANSDDITAPFQINNKSSISWPATGTSVFAAQRILGEKRALVWDQLAIFEENDCLVFGIYNGASVIYTNKLCKNGGTYHSSGSATGNLSVAMAGSAGTASGELSSAIATLGGTASGIRSVILSNRGGVASGANSALISNNSANASGSQSFALASISGTASGERSALISVISGTAEGPNSSNIASAGSASKGSASSVVASNGGVASGDRSLKIASKSGEVTAHYGAVIASEASFAYKVHSATISSSNSYARESFSTVIGSTDSNVYSSRNAALGANNSTITSGNNSIVTGSNNSISGSASFAAGNRNSISGDYAVVGGANNSVGNNSMAIGVLSSVSGNYSFSSGESNTVSGSYSSAIGNNNNVSGSYSHARGSNISISGASSFAIGQNLNILSSSSMALGFNVPSISTSDTFASRFDGGYEFKMHQTSSDRTYIVSIDNAGRLGLGFDIGKTNANYWKYKFSVKPHLHVRGNALLNERIRMIQSGNSGSWTQIDGSTVTSSSDLRLKEDIRPLENSIEKIIKLDGSSYQYIGDISNKKHFGFIAQEVQKVIPELIYESANGNIKDFKSINYQGFFPFITNAIRELYFKMIKFISKNDKRLSKLEKDYPNFKAELQQQRHMIMDIKRDLTASKKAKKVD